MTVVLYGPQGSGKTQLAPDLARVCGCARVIDEWKPGDPRPAGALLVTQTPGVRGALSIDQARAMVDAARATEPAGR